MRRDYSFRRYAFDIAALACARRPRVSVVVPSFNYEAYLPGRIGAILKQTYPIYEIFVADDASTDDSVAMAGALLGGCDVDHEIAVNAANSGSAFRQWLAGARRARGDIVWIAETDDLSEPDFLAVAIGAFADAGVVMSYTQSKMIDAGGAVIGADYLDYVSDIDGERWRRAHVAEGSAEIQGVLAVRNTVPNVSACLFRRPALVEALGAHIEEIAGYNIAGDWAAYVRVLEKGRISFHPRALNLHRRHEGGLTIGAERSDLLGEILTMQAAIRARYGASAEATRLARAYAQRLYQEFGLAGPKAPQLEDNPDFARLLQAGASAAAARNT
jgi:glycosyltransferase involved in cell wall biosynthesis